MKASQLSEMVDPHLLRAVQVPKVLGCLGGLWRNSAAATAEDQDRDFALSKPVKKIDDFISHDWLTGRWAKFLTLAYLYNTRAAVMLSMGGTLILALLMAYEVLPRPAYLRSDPFTVAGQEAVLHSV